MTSPLVDVFDGDTGATIVRAVPLSDCIDPRELPEDYQEAATSLTKHNEAWVGGGAAPLFHIVRTVPLAT